MQLFKAQVISTIDLLEEGKILALCPELGASPFHVIYASPFFSPMGGGFIAIPEEGTSILISKPDNDDTWYFMSCVVQPPEGANPTNVHTEKGLLDKRMYRGRHRPQKLVFQDSKGNRLVMTNSYEKDFINSKIELKSSGGKRVILSDSPLMDSIMLVTENGDGIVVTSQANEVHGDQSLEIRSRGLQTHVCRESSMNIGVVDGRELNLFNDSTGALRNPDDPEKYGNINIKSKFRDINITTDGENGNMFLDVLGQEGLLQIDSDGNIIIHCAGDIKLGAEGELHLKADGALKLQGADVTVKATQGGVNLEGTSDIGIQAGGNASMDGAQVHLNSGLSRGVPESIEVTPETNKYGV
jgi:hypothetical protein